MADYYISTYSAHTTILEKLLSENGVLKMLCIDAGGLKAPSNSYTRKDLLCQNNLRNITDKTLHAKVVLKNDGNKKQITILTGNLRKSTLDQRNIILNFPIQKKAFETTVSWFSSMNRSIVFISDGNKVISSTEVDKLENFFFESIIKQIKKSSSYSFYGFSPWGSKYFIGKVNSIPQINKICMYTRYANGKEALWTDFCSQRKDLKYCSYTHKDKSILPHFKCAFLIDNQTEKICWTYIGSMNFTKQALTKNIESALFFDGNNACKYKIQNIFDGLCSGDWWEERDIFENDEIDDSEIEEFEELDNFEERKLCNDLIKVFSKATNQLKLRKSYSEDKILKGNDFKLSCIKTIQVEAIDTFFHLIITPITPNKNNPFMLDIINDSPSETVRNSKDLYNLWKQITSIIDNPTEGGTRKNERGDEPPESPKLSIPVNLRFPIEKINLLSIEQIKLIHTNLEDLKINLSKLCVDGDTKKEYMKLFAIWIPLITSLESNYE